MTGTLTNILKGLVFLSLFFTTSQLQAQIDLELSLSQSIESPGAWKNYTVTAELVNKGSATAQNISIAIPKVAGTVYQGGNEFSLTGGAFNPYGNQRWTIASLGANQTVSLSLNLFTTTNAITATYAEVKQASPNDIDSTPGNGNGTSVNEDDEALSVGGGGNPGGGDRADLRMTDIQVQASAEKGALVNYTLDLKNIGTATANGDFKIAVYLSPTPGTGGGITEVGVINTGNIGVGTINDVSGAFSIPSNQPTGEQYLVFFIDANNAIEESNENNNKISRAFTVTGGGGNPSGDFCGFEKEYFQLVAPVFNQEPATQDVIASGKETDQGYAFKIREEVAQFDFEYRDLLIDKEGNTIDFDANADEPTTAAPTLPSGATAEVEMLGNNDVRVKVTNANGNVVFNKQYNDLTTSDNSADLNPRVLEKDGGYYLFGSWRNMNNGLFSLYLAELDANGNQVDFYEEGFDVDSYSFNPLNVLANGDILFTIDNLSTRSIFIARMNINGISWNKNITGDLVSNRVPQIDYVAAENAVYILIYNDPWTYVRKVAAGDGNTLWDVRLTDAFNPNSTETRLRNRTNHMIITEDGGVVVGYRYWNPSPDPNAVEVGQLDRNGNLVWWRSFPASYNLQARFQTEDGGFIFTGRDDEQFVVLKLNESGQALPACGNTGGGGEIDLSLDFDASTITPSIWSNFSSVLTVRNTGGQTATGVQVKVNRPNGLVYQGGNEFSSSQGSFKAYGNGVWNIGNIPAGGTAMLQINYFLTSSNALEVYTQVIGANEEDGDSTPNNGSVGVSNEDDEAILRVNSGSTPQNRLGAEEPTQQRPFLLRNIFPNPAIDGEVNVVISSMETAETMVNLYDSNGRLIRSQAISTHAGENQILLSTQDLSPGMYFINILGTHSKAASGKFFVEKR